MPELHGFGQRKLILFTVLMVLNLLDRSFAIDIPPKFYAVLASASVQTSPPEIALSWPTDPEATSYSLRRKRESDSSWGAEVSLPANATSYMDRDVAVGAIYEYQITKTTRRIPAYIGYGYIVAGINAPLVENRGTLILIVERTHAGELTSELTRLQQDLAGRWLACATARGFPSRQRGQCQSAD
jgi:hypothetical protein